VQNECKIAERAVCTNGVVMVTFRFSRVSGILEDGGFSRGFPYILFVYQASHP